MLEECCLLSLAIINQPSLEIKESNQPLEKIKKLILSRPEIPNDLQVFLRRERMNISAISTVFVLACASAALPASAAGNLTNSSIDWKGAYLGLPLGYAKGKANFSDNSYNGAPPFPTVSWSSKSGGSITGIHGRYNWRSHRTIYGLEGELGHLNL